ncbi:MAG: glycogen/starch/alpha-glucan phosphorylase [Chromatiaceae bacterium]|nr:glycogen/starch/alpha-glucan phosphorylase [Chromatiaceae bacterium]
MGVTESPATAGASQGSDERTRTGRSVGALKRAILDNLFYVQGRFPDVATENDWYLALAYTVRDRMLHRWLATTQTYKQTQARTVCYLSAEFLMGPHLGVNLINLEIWDNVNRALSELGLDLEELLDQEPEPGLGNGGLGRLAACFLDSLATLEIPAIGYGIRYEFGIFDQRIQDGWQVEVTDKWLLHGNPWELPRPKLTFDISFGGHTEHYEDDSGRRHAHWIPERVVRGVAYDTPVMGYGVNTVNLLRLWKSEAPESFDFAAFNVGDYFGAVDQKVMSENLSKVLYPNDEQHAGKRLRLEQQYFLVSCALRDMIRIHQRSGIGLDKFHEKYACQLNDTHPAIAVLELLRLLIDEHQLDSETAWEVTRRTFSYTNHTLLPEALERWPLNLFGSVLPRHLELLYQVNQRFLDDVRIKYRGRDDGRIGDLSLIEEDGEQFVRMANLACVGSYAINGVAALHTELLRSTLLKDFHDLWPEKFTNVTNGVSPRRFLRLANPWLSRLIGGRIGCEWVRDFTRLRDLESSVHDPAFLDAWRGAKRQAKERLARLIRERNELLVDPDSLFDVQVKRIHEYKRQHLNLLHVVALYNRIKDDPGIDMVPRTFIFGGKAAPGYRMAKMIIKAINAVADVVNRDPDVRGRLKVVFLPNFSVKNGQYIYPAADLSEQISTAGKEASGTGNMKFSMNGALTIGTLDGANVEIRAAVGEENFFLFGLSAEEARMLPIQGYDPRSYYAGHAELKAAIDLLDSGVFTHGDRDLFAPLTQNLLQHDPYLVLADFPAYLAKQREVADAWRDPHHWSQMSVLNVARMGYFSSDRAIREYVDQVWQVTPTPVPSDSP